MLAELFSQGIAGFWFRILPVVGEDDDVCACLGVDWQQLCPVLHFLGLIGHDVTSVVKNCFIVRDQWDELLQSVQKCVRCQITHCRGKTGSRTACFSIGEPKFRNPRQQEKKGGASLWLNTSSKVRKLKVDFGNAARKILQQRNYERIPNDANNITNTNNQERNGAEDDDGHTEEITDMVNNDLNAKTEHAHALDLDRRPRLSRTDAKVIAIHSKLNADERARHFAVSTALLWGWNDPCNTHKRRSFIANAACEQVACDMGCCRKLAATQLPVWHASLNNFVNDGEVADPLSPSNSGSKKHVELIEKEHEGCLHELFRQGQSTLGPLASFSESADIMNEKSASPGEERPTLSLSQWQLRRWFQEQGGQKKSSIAKPLLADEHEQQRVLWAR